MSEALAFGSLSAWMQDRHASALGAFRLSCRAIVEQAADRHDEPWRRVCRHALALPDDVSDLQARRFFESRFETHPVVDGASRTGLFTGYYEPEIEAAASRSPDYPVPLLGPPAGLVSMQGRRRPSHIQAGFSHAFESEAGLAALPDRAAIEQGALDALARPLAFLRSRTDAFFLHVQGSGRLRFPDGRVMRVSYAGKNGHPYTSIGRVLVERGLMPRQEVSMQSLRTWLDADPERAREVMWQNRSFVFFRFAGDGDPALGPVGQQGVQLTPGRSLAVDLSEHRPGSLFWLETVVPGPGGRSQVPLARLMVAQDTGSAIRGRIRGDIFFGSGTAAGERAGRMQARGRLVALVPKG